MTCDELRAEVIRLRKEARQRCDHDDDVPAGMVVAYDEVLDLLDLLDPRRAGPYRIS